MSADVCHKHQTADTRDDPCLYCLLEFIRDKAMHARKLKEVRPLHEVVEVIYQATKNRLTQRMVLKKGT